MPEDKTGSVATLTKCQFCGAIHSTPCPWVKAIEYHPDGSVKRVEFHDPAPIVSGVQVVWDPNQSNSSSGFWGDIASSVLNNFC
jgi:hypothetical protein